MFAQREKSASPAVWFGLLCLYLVATRWPLAPHYLYYFDSANFAFALDNFNPALHQPQPPGYPLFVALTRVIHFFVWKPEQVFLIAGLVAACAAVALIYALGLEMFGRVAGALSAVLLASNPVFWFGGITNQVRLFLAVSALAASLLGWRALRHPDRPSFLYGMFAALALCGGFRPELCVMLMPVALWVWWRCGHRPKDLALAFAALAATALPWLAVTAWAAGGPAKYIEAIWGYVNEQFQGSSALFGAAPPSAWHMVEMAVVWNLLGTLAWVWAIPFVWRGPRDSEWRERITFLGLVFWPIFLFSALVHIGDPDQAMGSISILCVAGGATLAAFCGNGGARRLRTVAAGVLVAQTVLFFVPPTKLAKAASYKAVAAVDRMTTAALTSIESLRGAGPITIVHWGSSVASRQLEYYFPEDYVVVLPASPSEAPQIWHQRRPVPAAGAGVGYLSPGSETVVCLLPWYSKGAELPGWNRKGTVYYTTAGSTHSLSIGGFSLIQQ